LFVCLASGIISIRNAKDKNLPETKKVQLAPEHKDIRQIICFNKTTLIVALKSNGLLVVSQKPNS